MGYYDPGIQYEPPGCSGSLCDTRRSTGCIREAPFVMAHPLDAGADIMEALPHHAWYPPHKYPP